MAVMASKVMAVAAVAVLRFIRMCVIKAQFKITVLSKIRNGSLFFLYTAALPFLRLPLPSAAFPLPVPLLLLVSPKPFLPLSSLPLTISFFSPLFFSF